MKISYYKILDIAFSFFVFSSITMSNSPIGKFIQLIFTMTSILFAFFKEKKIKTYHIFELLFILLIASQLIFNISASLEGTLDMLKTMIYMFLFSIGTYNYILYRKNFEHIIKIYTKSTIFSFCVIILLYFDTLLSFRLSAENNIKIGNFVLFGGASSTALSLMATIPMFLISLYPPNGNQKKAFPYIVTLSILSLITGTRKTIIVIMYSIYVLYSLNGKQRSFISIKTIIMILVIIVVSIFSVFKIPFLYKTIGTRVERSFDYILTSETTDSSIIVRNRMINQATKLFYQRKWFGWGADYFKSSKQNDLGYYSHNNFLEILVGCGIVGFIIYYAKYLYLIMGFLKFNSTNLKAKKIAKSCLFFIILMTILEWWQVTYFYRYIMIYQIFLLSILESNNFNLQKAGDNNAR